MAIKLVNGELIRIDENVKMISIAHIEQEILICQAKIDEFKMLQEKLQKELDEAKSLMGV